MISRYNDTLRKEKHEIISEETVRTWINEFLGLFGWNVQDTNQVLQERTLSGVPQQRLQEINSPHKRPDYTDQLKKAEKFYIYVSEEKNGALIKECKPPKNIERSSGNNLLGDIQRFRNNQRIQWRNLNKK